MEKNDEKLFDVYHGKTIIGSHALAIYGYLQQFV